MPEFQNPGVPGQVYSKWASRRWILTALPSRLKVLKGNLY